MKWAIILACLAVLVCVAVFLTTRGNSHDEQTIRAAISDEAADRFAHEDFARLEELAGMYRGTDARTPSGYPKLAVFYSAFRVGCSVESSGDEFWANEERKLAKWRQEFPTLPTAHLVYASFLFNHAWSYRGCGSAGTVKPENWQPFKDYIERARAYLEEHRTVAAGDPHWYDLMAQIAPAQGWGRARFANMINEGLRRTPGYYPIYSSAVDYYAPKWGGSAAEIEKFAQESVERTRSVEGDGLYARIYMHAAVAQYEDRLFLESRADWSEMKKGFEDIIARYPDNWNVNRFARFACMAGDMERTAELIGKMEGEPAEDIWDTPGSFVACKTFALGASLTPPQ